MSEIDIEFSGNLQTYSMHDETGWGKVIGFTERSTLLVTTDMTGIAFVGTPRTIRTWKEERF